MSTNYRHIDRLIVRNLAGEATSQEKHELQSWLADSEANRRYFEGFCFVNQKAETYYPKVAVNVDKAWENLQNQIKQKSLRNITTSKTRIIQLPLWLRIAAMIVLLAGVTWVIFDNTTSKTKPAMLALSSENTVLTKNMEDESEITLNRNSKLAWHDSFGKDNRFVALQGEAFFRVAEIPEMPFIVSTGEVFVKQLGTSFNIRSYPNDSIIEVFVKSGTVKFYEKDDNGIKLNSREKGIYNRNTKTFTKSLDYDINLLSYTNKRFVFQHSPLREVFEKLSEVYNVNIIIADKPVKDYSITVTFKNQEINFILDIITETLDLSFVKTDDDYTINFKPNKNSL